MGRPGSWHDARAFRLIAHLLEEDSLSLVSEGMNIIGDFAYPLLPQLTRPYKDEGRLNMCHKTFNRKLNAVWVV